MCRSTYFSLSVHNVLALGDNTGDFNSFYIFLQLPNFLQWVCMTFLWSPHGTKILNNSNIHVKSRIPYIKKKKKRLRPDLKDTARDSKPSVLKTVMSSFVWRSGEKNQPYHPFLDTLDSWEREGVGWLICPCKADCSSGLGTGGSTSQVC